MWDFVKENFGSLIAFLGTIFVAIMSMRNNQKSLQQQKELAEKNIQANIVAKARIEWIQEVRKIMADYLQKSHYYPHNYIKYKTKQYQNEEEHNKDTEEISSMVADIERLHYLLLLYFSDNEGNKEIREAIIGVSDFINSFKRTIKVSDSKIEYSDKPITDLLKLATDYFKKEWDRAKENK